MDKYLISKLSFVLLVLIIFLTTYSSSMPYQQQSLTGKLAKLFPSQPFRQPLEGIAFHYAGDLISVDRLGYYQFVEFFIRKATHFVTFGFYGVLIYLTLRPYIDSMAILSIVSIALTAGLAAMDELHQTYTPNRSGIFQDVVLDAVGAVVFVMVLNLFIGKTRF